MNLKQEKGITMIALIVTIVVMIIIAAIAIYSGKDTIKKANLESLKTNMLLIEAKTRGYVEEVNHKIGVKPDTVEETKKEEIRNEVYVRSGNLKKASEATSELSGITIPSSIDLSKCYYIPKEALNNMGLGKIEVKSDEAYLVQFNETDATVEIYNTKGYNGVYSLSELEEIQE